MSIAENGQNRKDPEVVGTFSLDGEEKPKKELRTLFWYLIVITISFTSFGLGRITKLEEYKVPIQIRNTQSAVVQAAAPTTQEIPKPAIVQQGGGVVASKTGSKYHLPWCSGAKRIKEENKVWFSSTEEAEKAGYEPAGNCKGI